MSAPLTPADCDLRGMPFMPLDGQRLLDSDLFLLSTGDEFKAALSLWWASWKQIPAASLPNDDRILAALARVDPKRWSKLRAVALRGFVLCADNRLYHPVVAAKANDAWTARQRQRDKANQRWKKPKGGSPDAPADAPADPLAPAPAGAAAEAPARPPADAAAYPAAMQGRGRGTVREDVVDAARANERTPAANDWPSGQALDHAKRLSEAANTLHLDLARQPGLLTTAGQIHAWRQAGASWDHDVVPVVVAMAAKVRTPVQTWKYFTAAVLQSLADNRAALSIPEATPNESPAHDRRPGPRLVAKRENFERGLAAAEQAAGVLADRRAL